MAVDAKSGSTSETPGWFGPPRGRRGAPPKNPVEAIVEKVFKAGYADVRDPSARGAIYRVTHYEEGCPNVHVQWRDAGSHPGSWDEACVDCSGFPCPGCGTGGDYRALARAVVAAILAGRGVRSLCSNTVLTSGGRADHYREADGRGEGSEGQEARDGRPEESEAPRPEDVSAADRPAAAAVARYVDLLQRRVSPTLFQMTTWCD